MLFLLGYADDYLKAKEHRKDGLSPVVKLGVQMILALGIAAYLYIDPPNALRAASSACPIRRNGSFIWGFFIFLFA